MWYNNLNIKGVKTMERTKTIVLDNGNTIHIDLSEVYYIEEYRDYIIFKSIQDNITLVKNDKTKKLIEDWLTYKELEHNRDYRKDEYFTLGAEVFKEYIRRNRDE